MRAALDDSRWFVNGICLHRYVETISARLELDTDASVVGDSRLVAVRVGL